VIIGMFENNERILNRIDLYGELCQDINMVGLVLQFPK